MRKPDLEVREVVCADTGKPMVKIPLWMANFTFSKDYNPEGKVKFVSDEARQKNPNAVGLADIEPLRRSFNTSNELDPLKIIDSSPLEESSDDFDEVETEVEAEETADDDMGA